MWLIFIVSCSLLTIDMKEKGSQKIMNNYWMRFLQNRQSWGKCLISWKSQMISPSYLNLDHSRYHKTRFFFFGSRMVVYLRISMSHWGGSGMNELRKRHNNRENGRFWPSRVTKIVISVVRKMNSLTFVLHNDKHTTVARNTVWRFFRKSCIARATYRLVNLLADN